MLKIILKRQTSTAKDSSCSCYLAAGKAQVWTPRGAFLCRVCMLSPCLHRLSPRLSHFLTQSKDMPFWGQLNWWLVVCPIWVHPASHLKKSGLVSRLFGHVNMFGTDLTFLDECFYFCRPLIIVSFWDNGIVAQNFFVPAVKLLSVRQLSKPALLSLSSAALSSSLK